MRSLNPAPAWEFRPNGYRPSVGVRENLVACRIPFAAPLLGFGARCRIAPVSPLRPEIVRILVGSVG